MRFVALFPLVLTAGCSLVGFDPQPFVTANGCRMVANKADMRRMGATSIQASGFTCADGSLNGTGTIEMYDSGNRLVSVSRGQYVAGRPQGQHPFARAHDIGPFDDWQLYRGIQFYNANSDLVRVTMVNSSDEGEPPFSGTDWTCRGAECDFVRRKFTAAEVGADADLGGNWQSRYAAKEFQGGSSDAEDLAAFGTFLGVLGGIAGGPTGRLAGAVGTAMGGTAAPPRPAYQPQPTQVAGVAASTTTSRAAVPAAALHQSPGAVQPAPAPSRGGSTAPNIGSTGSASALPAPVQTPRTATSAPSQPPVDRTPRFTHWDQRLESADLANQYWVWVRNEGQARLTCFVGIRYSTGFGMNEQQLTDNSTVHVSPGSQQRTGMVGAKGRGVNPLGYDVRCHSA